MSIAFYLTLKSEVVYETPDATVRQLMERLDYHNYSAIPILDYDGRYIGTITEGDILRRIRKLNGDKGIRDLEKVTVNDLERGKKISAGTDRCQYAGFAVYCGTSKLCSGGR